jgi:hypothetical protein
MIIALKLDSVAELEQQGAETFGPNHSWHEVSALAPDSRLDYISIIHKNEQDQASILKVFSSKI